MEALRLADLVPAALLVAPGREFKTSPTGSLLPGEVPVNTLVMALREAGFRRRIVAGKPSFFPEFNRNPLGPSADAVYLGGCGIVHAADDLSVMETLSVYPAILTSAAQRGGARPLWLGPCTLGSRHAPYGAAVTPNPENRRIPMARNDPRDKTLFAAAYALGLAAACAGFLVDCLTLASPFGPFGVMAGDGSKYPLCGVQAMLAAAAGHVGRRVAWRDLAAVGWEDGDLIRVVVANITGDGVLLSLPDTAALRLLELGADWGNERTGTLTLGPCRTALVSYASGRDL